MTELITTFLARITPACKEVAALTSESLDRSLPWPTRLKLRLHYWICEACARYRRQLLTVRETLRRQVAQAGSPQQEESSHASAARLKDAFRARKQ